MDGIPHSRRCNRIEVPDDEFVALYDEQGQVLLNYMESVIGKPLACNMMAPEASGRRIGAVVPN